MVWARRFFSKVVRLSVVAVEGARFLWVMRRATPAYWKWRLGTVYGSFCRPLGKAPVPGELDVLAHRSLADLWGDVWKDVTTNFERISSYLLWQRDMRRRRHHG